MDNLEGKTLLVTGGSSGIGASIVRMAAEAGARVVFSYWKNGRRAQAMVQKFGKQRLRAVKADFASPDDVARLWRTAVEWAGRVDVLVNNAATRRGLDPEASPAKFQAAWHHALQVNLTAAAQLARDAVRHYADLGGGIVINISSRPAFRGDRPDFFHDGASKAGLVSLARGIARFHAADGEIPLGAMGRPEEVADVVLYLASGRARYATGATIDVNGASYLH